MDYYPELIDLVLGLAVIVNSVSLLVLLKIMNTLKEQQTLEQSQLKSLQAQVTSWPNLTN